MSLELPDRIIAAATVAYGVSRADLLAGGYRNCSAARNAAMAIIMDLCPRMKYVTLGMIMDGRQPKTAKYGVMAHRRLLESGCPITTSYDRKIRATIGWSHRSEADVFAAMGL